MKLATAITTAPRDGVSPLARTVASLRRSGIEHPLIFAEPGSSIPAWVHEVSTIHRRGQRLGAWENWLCSLFDTLRAEPDAEAILMCQDDVLVCRELPRFLDEHLWPSPRCGLVQLYTSACYRRRPDGLSPLAFPLEHHLMGACACLMPRHVAQQVVNWAFRWGWRGHPRETIDRPVDKVAIDPFLGETMMSLGYEIWLCNPSLAEHKAQHSSLGHGSSRGGRRQAAEFIGEQASPFVWYRPPSVRYSLPSGETYERPLGVVIPIAGDCEDLLVSCLDHLIRYAGRPLVVVVVDNGTPSNVASRVLERLTPKGQQTSLHSVRSETNRGYTWAINRGLKCLDDHTLVERKHDVLLLNSDCRVGPGCVPLLSQALCRAPRAAAVGPVTRDNGHQSLQNPFRCKLARIDPGAMPGVSAVLRHHFAHGLSSTERAALALGGNYCGPERVLSFFCTLIRREALDEVGPLCEALADGLGADDLWCDGARAAGWSLLVQHGAFADHDHGETFRRLGLDRRQLSRKAAEKYKALRTHTNAK